MFLGKAELFLAISTILPLGKCSQSLVDLGWFNTTKIGRVDSATNFYV